jgi:hypothetical protein
MPGGVVDNTEKTRADVEVAHAAPFTGRVGFEFFNDPGNSCGATNWGAGNNPYVVPFDIAYHCIPLLAKPELNARIQNLISDRVPAMRKYKFARECKIGHGW